MLLAFNLIFDHGFLYRKKNDQMERCVGMTSRQSQYRRHRNGGRDRGGRRAYAIIIGLGSVMALFLALGLPHLGIIKQQIIELASKPREKGAQPSHTPDLNSRGQTNTSIKAATVPPFSNPSPAHVVTKKHFIIVKPGDTLVDILRNSGATREETYRAIRALQVKLNPRNLKVGQKIDVTFQQPSVPSEKQAYENNLFSISMARDLGRSVIVTRMDDGFKTKEVVRPLKTSFVRVKGTISGSLFLSAQQAGIPVQIIMELIRIFSWDVDFQRDIRRGDKFEVLFERFKSVNGQAVQNGEILFAALSTQSEHMDLYRYTGAGGETYYYNGKGQSARKALMKTPVDGARLSSRYGKRRHPILGYNKMHRGVDFAAPTGTPVMAAGDGVIERASKYGAYGNYIRIRHNSAFKTAYAHLHSYAKDIRIGKHVRQGQHIGYIGSTGRSTGPHLHYEVHQDGKKVNPLKLKLPTVEELQGDELIQFFKAKNEIEVARQQTANQSRTARANVYRHK